MKLVLVVAALLALLGFVWVAQPRGAMPIAEKTPEPSQPVCITIEAVMDSISNLSQVARVPIMTGFEFEGEDVVILTHIAIGIPTSLHHRLENGCLVKTWEEPFDQ